MTCSPIGSPASGAVIGTPPVNSRWTNHTEPVEPWFVFGPKEFSKIYRIYFRFGADVEEPLPYYQTVLCTLIAAYCLGACGSEPPPATRPILGAPPPPKHPPGAADASENVLEKSRTSDATPIIPNTATDQPKQGPGDAWQPAALPPAPAKPKEDHPQSPGDHQPPLDSPATAPRPALPAPRPLPLAFAPPDCSRNPNHECRTLDETIDEASGLTASLANPGIYYTHNDDGDPKVYAINLSGEILAEIQLLAAQNRDFEDIESTTIDGVHYIYQADIGDGRGNQPPVLYRFSDPVISGSVPLETIAIKPLKITLKLPPKSPDQDFEAFMIDPRNQDIYLFQKGEQRVYRGDGNQVRAAALEITMTEVKTNATWGKKPSAAAFSPRGDEFIIRDDANRSWLYQLDPSESVTTALSRKPYNVILANEPNGEAICFTADGRDLLTVSDEDKNAPFSPQPVTIIRRQ